VRNVLTLLCRMTRPMGHHTEGQGANALISILPTECVLGDSARRQSALGSACGGGSERGGDGRDLRRTSYVAAQGAALQRAGRIYLRKEGAETWVGGDVVEVVRGELRI